jgi:ubiquinone/menaquinone biosynthesis C-methylase UbiE
MDLWKIKDYWEKNAPMSFTDKEDMSYEEKRSFRYGLQDYMHEVFQFNLFSGKLVLDLGSGAGVDSAEFARCGAEVVSVELTSFSVKLTKNLLKEAHVYAHACAVQASAQRLPFKSESLDCVYCFGVIHHILDAENVLSEIHRVLKVGGKIMAMVYHKDSLLYAYSIIYLRGVKQGLLSKYSQDEILSMFSERIPGCPYTKAYTKEEAIAVFSHLFKNLDVSVHYDVIDTERERKLKIAIPKDNDLGWHLIIKGEK